MKVFVTGTAGQLGCDLMKELEKRGYEEGLAASLFIFLPIMFLTAAATPRGNPMTGEIL